MKALTIEEIERSINPPVVIYPTERDGEIVCPIDWPDERRYAHIKRVKRSRAAKRGWRTRKAM